MINLWLMKLPNVTCQLPLLSFHRQTTCVVPSFEAKMYSCFYHFLFILIWETVVTYYLTTYCNQRFRFIAHLLLFRPRRRPPLCPERYRALPPS